MDAIGCNVMVETRQQPLFYILAIAINDNIITRITVVCLSVTKIKASHTRYRVWGQELIPVYRQSARRCLTISHPPSGRLPLLSTRPSVTFQAAEHHRF